MSVTPFSPALAARTSWRYALAERYAAPAGHSRPSDRNFFEPAARWQFSGLRLAQDGAC